MLKRSKGLAVVMSVCLCLALLAPVFSAPQADAAASISYSAVNPTSFKTSSGFQLANIDVLIDIPDTIVFGNRVNWVTVKLPSGVEVSDGDVECNESGTGDYVYCQALFKNKNTIDVYAKNQDPDRTDETKLILKFKNLKVRSGSGDIVASFIPPSGSAFPGGSVTIGKIIGQGATSTMVSSVKTVGDGVCELDTLTIAELTKGVFQENDEIKLELSKGFEWVEPDSSPNGTPITNDFVLVGGGWSFSGLNNLTYNASQNPEGGYFGLSKDNDRVLLLKVLKPISKSSAGRIDIGGFKSPYGACYLKISATDSAKHGDVTVTVSSKKATEDEVTEQEIVVAKYADFGVALKEGTKKDVISGRTEQKIGDFYIEEAVAGSLIKGRTISFELPSGVKWTSKYPKVNFEDGDSSILSSNPWQAVSSSKERTIKLTIADNSAEVTKIKFKDGEVKIEPGFEGPIEIKVYGSAGVEGTVVVADAVKPIQLKAEKATDIIIGQANQKVADILIVENKKEAILDDVKNDSNMIVIGLEEGYKFSKKPTVTVDEDGDLEIDSTKLQNNDSELRIVIKNSSSKASTIKISDIYLTALRYVPVGPVKAILVEATDYDSSDAAGSTALVDWDTDKSAGDVVIATCVTPAEGSSAQFKIGSNIYTVNGISKVMDVAPYVKDNRTYVPIRFMGYSLGLTDADIVWDEATQKVTLTKGDNVVELTIGTTAILVNGESQTMDVAPEIVDNRTMLPARFVAEGLGATVGWDASTQTVLIQQ